MHCPKYKVWVVEEKKMYDSVLSLHWLYGEDLSEIQVDAEEGPFMLGAVDANSVVLMPTIGILDFKGRDVYLFDIVRMHDGNHVVVRWNEMECAYYLQGTHTWMAMLAKYGTVVGNLYPDADLWARMTKDFK